MGYVHDELNYLYFTHRSNSYNNDCRFLQCHTKYIGPVLNALQSMLSYECSACGFEFRILSEKKDRDVLSTNDGIVLGCISNGIGFYQLESIFCAANLLCHDYRS